MGILSNSKIIQISKSLNRFNLKNEAYRSAKDNASELVDLNRDQMREGKDGDGDMRNYNSFWYAEEKSGMPSYRAPYPRVDLYYTGSFQNKMFINLSKTSFSFWSKDSKTQELVEKEGPAIFVLNPEKLLIAQSIIQEDLQRKIKAIFE